jgi:hypothetical protein
MRINELMAPGGTPQTTASPTGGTAPGGAQTGLSPQQQLAVAQKQKTDQKKEINDQIAELMKQMADLRKQLAQIR